MGLESAANIGLLIAIVGLMLFFLRRMDRMKDELKADIVRMETGLKGDMVRMEAGIRADMAKMESGIREDMASMDARHKEDMASMDARHKEDMAKLEAGLKEDIAKLEANINLKHAEVREDLRDVRSGLVVVGERQARLEGILEGLGRAPAPEPAVAATAE